MSFVKVETQSQLQQAIGALQNADVLAYDIESTGLDPHTDKVHLIVLANETYCAVVDCHKLETRAVYKALKQLLETKLLLIHNATFDIKFAFHYGVTIQTAHCSLVCERLLSAGLNRPAGFSLKALIARYFDQTLEKEVRSEFIGKPDLILEDRHFEYAAGDTHYLFDLYRLQIEQIKNQGLEQIYAIEMPLLPCTALIEYTGVALDRAQLESLVPHFELLVQSAERTLQTLFIQSGAVSHILIDEHGFMGVKLGSRPSVRIDKKTGQKVESLGQVYDAFLTLNVNPTNKKGLPSLAAKDLLRWDAKHTRGVEYDYAAELGLDTGEDREDTLAQAIVAFGGLKHPVLRAYAFYIAARKLLDAYVIGTLEKYNQTTGRIHGWFSQTGARSTGRYSSDLQQIPKDDKLERLSIPYSIRKCFVAAPKRKFIIADYAGIELVILADLSGDELLGQLAIDSAIDKDDIHIYVVRKAFGHLHPKAHLADISLRGEDGKYPNPYKALRNAAKPTSYGIAYGITAIALSETITKELAGLNVKCTIPDAEIILQDWKYKAFAKAGQWLDNASRVALSRGYAETLLGRKRYFDLEYARDREWKQHAIEREGCNSPIQGSCADIVKIAMRDIYTKLDNKRARIIWTVHDELIIEAVDSYVETAQRIMVTGMEQAAQRVLPLMGQYVKVHPAISTRYDK